MTELASEILDLFAELVDRLIADGRVSQRNGVVARRALRDLLVGMLGAQESLGQEDQFDAPPAVE